MVDFLVKHGEVFLNNDIVGVILVVYLLVKLITYATTSRLERLFYSIDKKILFLFTQAILISFLIVGLFTVGSDSVNLQLFIENVLVLSIAISTLVSFLELGKIIYEITKNIGYFIECGEGNNKYELYIKKTLMNNKVLLSREEKRNLFDKYDSVVVVDKDFFNGKEIKIRK